MCCVFSLSLDPRVALSRPENAQYLLHRMNITLRITINTQFEPPPKMKIDAKVRILKCVRVLSVRVCVSM